MSHFSPVMSKINISIIPFILAAQMHRPKEQKSVGPHKTKLEGVQVVDP